VSASEYNGGSPDPADKSYVEVQIDDVKVVSPAANFVPVEGKDLLAASEKYAQEVALHRAQHEVEGVLTTIDSAVSEPMNGRQRDICVQ
jgi:hypothetical protein